MRWKSGTLTESNCLGSCNANQVKALRYHHRGRPRVLKRQFQADERGRLSHGETVESRAAVRRTRGTLEPLRSIGQMFALGPHAHGQASRDSTHEGTLQLHSTAGFRWRSRAQHFGTRLVNRQTSRETQRRETPAVSMAENSAVQSNMFTFGGNVNPKGERHDRKCVTANLRAETRLTSIAAS